MFMSLIDTFQRSVKQNTEQKAAGKAGLFTRISRATRASIASCLGPLTVLAYSLAGCQTPHYAARPYYIAGPAQARDVAITNINNILPELCGIYEPTPQGFTCTNFHDICARQGSVQYGQRNPPVSSCVEWRKIQTSCSVSFNNIKRADMGQDSSLERVVHFGEDKPWASVEGFDGKECGFSANNLRQAQDLVDAFSTLAVTNTAPPPAQLKQEEPSPYEQVIEGSGPHYVSHYRLRFSGIQPSVTRPNIDRIRQARVKIEVSVAINPPNPPAVITALLEGIDASFLLTQESQSSNQIVFSYDGAHFTYETTKCGAHLKIGREYTFKENQGVPTGRRTFEDICLDLRQATRSIVY